MKLFQRKRGYGRIWGLVTSHAVKKSGPGYCVESGLWVDMSGGGQVLWSSRWERGGQLGGDLASECAMRMVSLSRTIQSLQGSMCPQTLGQRLELRQDLSLRASSESGGDGSQSRS